MRKVCVQKSLLLLACLGALAPANAGRANGRGGRRERKFSEGLAPFFTYDGGRVLHGYVSRSGEVVIEPIESTETGPFVGGLARVIFYEQSDAKPGTAVGHVDKAGRFIEEKYGYIYRVGRFVWRPKWRAVGPRPRARA